MMPPRVRYRLLYDSFSLKGINLFLISVVFLIFVYHQVYLEIFLSSSLLKVIHPVLPSNKIGVLNGGNEDSGSGGVQVKITKPFKILFYTEWYGHVAATLPDFRHLECNDEFLIISNKSEYAEADVIVFQAVDLFDSQKVSYFPPHRDINVPWIFASQEASFYRPLFGETTFDGIFNWTWSTRSDSLIHPNFTESMEKHEIPDSRWVYGSQYSLDFLSTKTKLAAWVVSNCYVQVSRRNELVTSLSQLGVQVDKFGKCGNHTCKNGKKCFEELGQSYKFYFSLENALCEDYITEKIYHGLLHGMVPVVLAAGNVGMNAPPNSFINVLDFPTISELADRIKYLDQNPQEYFKYFEWRQIYNANVTGSSKHYCHIWRKMKEYKMKLLGGDEGSKYRHTYDRLDDWYSKFYNYRLNKTCNVCLSKGEVNITHPSLTREILYNDPSQCV